MHSVVRSDFLNGLLFLDRLQRDSCFHLRAEAPPLPRFHFCSLSEAAILYLIDWSEFWGAPQALDVRANTMRPDPWRRHAAQKYRERRIQPGFVCVYFAMSHS